MKSVEKWIKISGVGAIVVALSAACSQQTTSDTSSQQTASDAGDARIEQIRQATSQVTPERIKANEETTKDWLSYNLGYDEKRHSKLNQINTGNVDELGLAWTFELNSKRGVESTPIVVEGVMYVTAPWSKVYALDARTGEQIWSYDPEVPKSYYQRACCDVVNRGVAVANGKVFVGTLDGYMVALDAATGEVAWKRDTFVEREGKYLLTITGAPRIVGDNVVIGNGGAELSARGYVTAYDVDTGEQDWRWFSIPRDPNPPFRDASMEMAAKTWDPEGVWPDTGGGGTIWDSMAYDPELGLLYLGVGNGNPWNREVRSPAGGDNLFVSSIVALDAETGEYQWHYQEVPGDTWDFTATQHMILADMKIDGEERKVLLHAPKSGFFYVIDRTDGSFISAEPFVDVNWAEGYDDEGRPILTDNARATEGGKEFLPNPYGAHNWHPMSFNPETGLVYLPVQGIPLAMESDPNFKVRTHQPGHPMSNLGWNLGHLLNTVQPEAKPFGHLLAWDPVEQKAVWRQEYLAPWNGGTTTTAGGLVFQGTADARFLAYDAQTGEALWNEKVSSGVIAGPSTYEIDGEQYVTIAVGWGGVYGLAQRHAERMGDGRVYTFKLGGEAEMPDVPMVAERRKTELVSGVEFDPEDVGPGAQLYVSNCLFCHGVPAVNNGGALPNPGYSEASVIENLPDLLYEGAWTEQGMPNFSDKLSKEEISKITAFIQQTANSVAKAAKEK